MEDWKKKYRDRIKEAITDEELDAIIVDIFDDAYEQASEECDCSCSGEPIPWEDLD